MKYLLFLLTILYNFQIYAQICEADFSYQIINDFDVILTDISIADSEITKWNWDFGNGQTSMEQNPVTEYASPGTYQICLKIETTDECNYTFCMPIDIIDTTPTSECKASFDYDQEENKIQFYDNSWWSSPLLFRLFLQ